MYVPKLSTIAPTPLVVFFHGAGGSAAQASLVLPFADERGFAVLAIDSRGATWDLIEDELGPDVQFLDRALHLTFEQLTVDPARIAASGFSDGASYALSLAVANGDLFSHALAFSPGFLAPREVHGRPRILVTHGVADRVLPIDACSRRIVPRLIQARYAVEYREFDGGHLVPASVAKAAIAWLFESENP